MTKPTETTTTTKTVDIPHINDIMKRASGKTALGETDVLDDVVHTPDPVGHYMLIALPEKVEVTRGGVYVPDATADSERAATVVGQVLAMGPDCYEGVYPNGSKRFPGGPWCTLGNKVVFGRYTGSRFKINGVEFRILADDQIIAVLTDEAAEQVSGL